MIRYMKEHKIGLNLFILCVLCVFCGNCAAQPSKPAASAFADPNRIDPVSPLEQLLEKINLAVKNIQSCRAAVEYLFIQEPELLNSQTLRKGTLYYQKNDNGSKLRLNFDTVKQDDAEEQKKPEHYLFDGVWLTKIDYTLRQIDRYQQARTDKPVEVLDYVSHHFPIVGFSGTDTLQKQFFIQQVKPSEQENRLHHLLLKVKPDSAYKDDYTQIDLWADGQSFLPVRMQSVSTQGDICDIRLSKIELNRPLPEDIFEIEAPADFSKHVRTLDPKTNGKESPWPQDL